MACGYYNIQNTGVTTATVSFTSCESGCIFTGFDIPVGETYYVNSDGAPTLVSGSTIITNETTPVTDKFNFSGSCGDNFYILCKNGLGPVFELGYIYCMSAVTQCSTLDVLPTQCFEYVGNGELGYPQYSTHSTPAYAGTELSVCESGCPCAVAPTPTPTITPTQTPTPSITPTPITCETYYCITNTGYDYDNSYNIAGIFNGKEYWTGETNSYYIYFNSGNTQWCLSTSLGGSCLLFGKSPCTSQCPDLCEEYFSNEICPTPTPTPTINCDVLDFEAIFNCDVPTTPTPTATPTTTPTNTPTPTSTDICGYFNAEVTVFAYTPTPTTTPTNTPTPSITIDRPFNFSGDVTFNTLNSEIQCPSSSKFQDCYNGNIYSTTNSLVVPGNIALQPYMIFEAIVDGETKCISYLDVDTQIIGINNIQLVSGPLGYSNLGECIYCAPQVTPTPTITQTQTPTPSPTPLPCLCWFIDPGKLTLNGSYESCDGIQVSLNDITLAIDVCSPLIPLIGSPVQTGNCSDESCGLVPGPPRCTCYIITVLSPDDSTVSTVVIETDPCSSPETQITLTSNDAPLYICLSKFPNVISGINNPNVNITMNASLNCNLGLCIP